MTIKIGDKSYATTRPDTLDDQLIAATGCNAAEVAQQLAGAPLAGQVAAALRPFLPKDAPSTPELAAAITAADVERVRGEVLDLYRPKPATRAPANG